MIAPDSFGDAPRLVTVKGDLVAKPRVMKQPRKNELRARLAVAEAQAAYHAGMRPMARLRRWWARVRA